MTAPSCQHVVFVNQRPLTQFWRRFIASVQSQIELAVFQIIGKTNGMFVQQCQAGIGGQAPKQR
ncbi:hypothetical protein N018_03830 [Pseudomonas syringae CC1557]|uniref:Uncharacterized protein n=1 Tax=Pseudomonas syringae CC1557 TaxID=1357279 RepID=W0MY36_PSESX|nr:hypothetical protein N018_03830 [Pseudomonas syringae CC1557]